MFEAPEKYANICAEPATRKNPLNGSTIVERAGTDMHEKMWLRSIANRYYLWYDELLDVNPSALSHDEYFFAHLRGQADRFSSYYTFDDYHDAQNGISTDLGINFGYARVDGVPGLLIYYVEPDSPNADRLARGDLITAVDGLVATDVNLDALIAAIFEHEAGDSFNLTVLPDGSGAPTTVTVTLDRGSRLSVPITQVLEAEAGPVGYLLFNLNNDNTEVELVQAITDLKARNVRDLVLDLRYNGGGYIYVASQLGYMIAGPQATRNAVFYRQIYNDRFPSTDPFTGERQLPLGFINQAFAPELGTGTELPSLNLDRVFVLTSEGTCSASEALINGLNGIGVEVIQIGTTTCGKPYAYSPQVNCGKVYYHINSRGANNLGFSEYDAGFGPEGATDASATNPGCVAYDDWSTPLGDRAEPLLAAALAYRANGSCSTTSTAAALGSAFRPAPQARHLPTTFGRPPAR